MLADKEKKKESFIQPDILDNVVNALTRSLYVPGVAQELFSATGMIIWMLLDQQKMSPNILTYKLVGDNVNDLVAS